MSAECQRAYTILNGVITPVCSQYFSLQWYAFLRVNPIIIHLSLPNPTPGSHYATAIL